MANFFINRPIFAWVVAIFIMIAGVMGIKSLPIAQYPSVASPTVTLTASYPGASAKVLEDSVLSVIERNMFGVEGLDYITTSATSSGTGSVTLSFTPDTDADIAQVNVQNKLSEVTPLLPAAVQQNGVNVSKARSNFLMVVMLSSDSKSTAEIADFAQRSILPELQRVEGVGNVNLFGSQRAMRIWVDPAKLKNYNLSFADVNAAIQSQNVQISAGSIGSLPAQVGQTISATITAEGQLSTEEEFGNIIVRADGNGAHVYLKDVANIELGSQSYASGARLNGKPTVGMGVSLSTTGNALAAAADIKAKMAEIERFMPEGVTWSTPYDSSTFVKLSIEKVIATLVEAVVLVFLVMFLFLQNFRYTLIPTIVVPISLLGAFASIAYLGMSINVMTMFAMVLVIGIVVDDAIVVVENVERIMAEEGLSPKAATKKAMKQISGAVIGITAVLISVFVPMAMFSGATGNIYRQFSVTMALAIAFSAFLALSLTPALCATLLKPIQHGHHQKKGFFAWFNRKFESSTQRYTHGVQRVLHKTGRMLAVYLGLIIIAVVLMMRLPTSFIPSEDQGSIMTSIQLPAGATKERTDKTLEQVTQAALSMPEVENIITISGFSFSGSGQNMAMGFVKLKDWSERTGAGSDATSVAGKITMSLMKNVRDGFAIAVNPPPIMELGSNSGFSFYLQDRNNQGHEALLATRNALMAKMRSNPEMFNPSTVRASGLEDAPQLKIDINRQAAAAQGIDFSSIRAVLATALGSSYVNDFPNAGRLQRVIVQATPESRMQADDVLALTVKNNQGVAVPLGSIATVKWVTGQEQSERFNGYPAMQLTGEPAAGQSSGDAMAEVQRLVDELGNGYSLQWSGQSREENKGSSETLILYAFSAVAVFLVLAALYESWSIPLAVILVVPLGIFGVVLGVTGRNTFDLGIQSALIASGLMPAKAARGASYLNDIYFTIGMVTVMGLSAKNAILIIEFARELQMQGKTALEAALHAARQRFRPILMTSFAFILGVFPLYIATGASSGSQRAIGTSVFWGMLIGTILSVFFVPLFYTVVRRFFKPSQHELELAQQHQSSVEQQNQ